MNKRLLALAVICTFTLLVSSVSAFMTPETLNATLYPGESVDEHKTVFLPGAIPKADVVFVFDLTGSMSSALSDAKANAIDIMDDLDVLISDAQYGVMSHMDYTERYTSHGYTGTYGYTTYGDYPYSLDQSVTADRTAVSDAITALALGGGADGPESYTRPMYESYADPSVGWRSGAKRILIMLNDNVPHDNDLNEGVPGKTGTWTTGGDPGPDELILTADDLDLQTVLGKMADNDIVLLVVRYYSYAIDYWEYWAGLTGGAVYEASSYGDLAPAVAELVGGEAAHVDTLTLKAETDYEEWLTTVTPAEYLDIDIPTEGIDKEFDITITVPAGTPPGTYTFNIIADADGASYGEQTVTIIVHGIDHVIPEVPFGTILVSASLLIGFIAYIGIPRFRKPRKMQVYK
jgi:hypothetical protein